MWCRCRAVRVVDPKFCSLQNLRKSGFGSNDAWSLSKAIYHRLFSIQEYKWLLLRAGEQRAMDWHPDQGQQKYSQLFKADEIGCTHRPDELYWLGTDFTLLFTLSLSLQTCSQSDKHTKARMGTVSNLILIDRLFLEYLF